MLSTLCARALSSSRLPSHRRHMSALSGGGRARGLLRALQEGQAVPWHGAGCTCATHAALPSFDSAFEFQSSAVRYGVGVTGEVGWDALRLGGARSTRTRVLLFVDPGVAALHGESAPLRVALDSLKRAGLTDVDVFDAVQVEPTDVSVRAAIAHARAFNPDVYLAVGGGSTMDTAKIANLYASHPTSDFLDHVNAPIGLGKVVPGPVRPLIAVPTTAGTGSETTGGWGLWGSTEAGAGVGAGLDACLRGMWSVRYARTHTHTHTPAHTHINMQTLTGVAIFDHTPLRAKTGIASRLLKPTLGIIGEGTMLCSDAWLHAPRAVAHCSAAH